MSKRRHITDYLKNNAVSDPDKSAIIFEDKDLSWLELWQKVEAAAAALQTELGSSEPQVVGLLMANSIEFIVAYLAIIHLGHIALPIDVIFKELEIAAVIEHLEPVTVITDEAGQKRLPGDARMILVEKLMQANKARPSGLIRQPADDQVASLLFTTGTTGKPKAVAYTHGNHIWNIEVCSKVWAWDKRDSLLMSLRLTHMHGLVIGLSGVIYHANTMYLQENFSAEATARALASGKITMFTNIPYAYIKLVELDDTYYFSSVRVFISGAAPLPPPVWKKFKQKYGHEIIETYGSTETGRIAANPLQEPLPGSPGLPLPGVKVKIAADGELLVKSQGVFPGYWHNESATKAGVDDEGYWRTGDLAELKNGRLVLKGRAVERIRRYGYTISPRDVEWAMHKLSGVKDIYVLGTPDSESGDDRLAYFIVGDVSEAEVTTYCKQNLPSVWRPDKIVLMDSLPRTRSGKPDLVKLRTLA